MPTELSIASVGTVDASLNVTNIPAGGTVEIQIADNPRFDGLVTFASYSASPAAIVGLNQRSIWFARARGVSSAGVNEAWGATLAFRTGNGTAQSTIVNTVLVTPAVLAVPEPVMGFHGVTNGEPGFPPQNALRDDPQMVFAQRDTGTGFVFIVEMPQGVPVDTFALLDTTLSEAATLHITGTNVLADALANTNMTNVSSSDKARAGANLYQRPGYHVLRKTTGTPVNRYYRFAITGAGAARQNLLMIRYLIIGLTRATKNISADKIESPLDLGTIDRTRDGAADRIFGHRMRKVDFELSLLTEMQWETVYSDLRWKIGSNEPVLVVPNARTGPYYHDRILFGTLAQSRATNLLAPRFSHAFSVESLI